MKLPDILFAFLTFACGNCFAAEKPNVIVIIYADDLGYGDLSCQGATKLKTPRIDQLAAQGRRFTDAHSASATCTPSRFAMLSGKYPWRENLWSPVFLRSPLVLKQDSFALADLAKNAGHATAIIGKWHLGFGENGPPYWNQDLKPGPLELGFDHYFGVPVVNSHPPFVYVDDQRVIGLDPANPLIVAPNAVSSSKAYEGKIKPDAPKAQVFNLTPEGSQTENIIGTNPKVTADLKARLAELRASTRTAP